MGKYIYGIITIRNGIPMISWIDKKEIRIEKKHIKHFFDKSVYPTLIKVKITKGKDITEIMNFDTKGNHFYKLERATEKEWFVSPMENVKPKEITLKEIFDFE